MEFVKINENFEIGKYPVTNGEYEDYCQAANKPYPKLIANTLSHINTRSVAYQLFRLHPVVYVNKFDAERFCEFYNSQDGESFRLPTESEWELAASGNEKRTYPWGNDWKDGRCNTYESGIGTTTSVGSFPRGNTSEGVCDMAGNVWEWTSSEYAPNSGTFVIRGGSWNFIRDLAVCAFRFSNYPNDHFVSLGFRVARTISSNVKKQNYEILYKDPKTSIIYPPTPDFRNTFETF